MSVNIRSSRISDLPFLEKTEQVCFPDFQRSSRRSLRLSLTSPTQQVWIAEIQTEGKTIPVGSMVLILYQHTLRLFSLAVLPEFQGQGIGGKLVAHCIEQAQVKGFERISLEARMADCKLVDWYGQQGFIAEEELTDYYTAGEHGIRMYLMIPQIKEKKAISNIIVVDNPKQWALEVEGLRVISSKKYLSDPEFQEIKNVRIFNLSNTYRYQSIGYYVSLMASAREHRAIPNVTTIRDFRNVSIIRTIASDIDELMQSTLSKINPAQFSFNIYFGHTIDPAFRHLGQKLYSLFETPLLQVIFNHTDRWVLQRVTPLSLDKIDKNDFERIQDFAKHYFSKKRFFKPRFQNYKYDLAILVNPEEKNPPSNKQALENFREAARKVGFYTEFIGKDDYDRMSEFDALFIRETTNVNDHTYHFSRMAYAEGLVVIDDPWSILRCSNKIFLNERMKQNRITTPVSWVIGKGMYKPSEFKYYKYPLVLKQPDSAFSLGVTKVNNAEEMEISVNRLLKKSDLIIVQEFLPSEYDWRIGVLDEKPLFACKYYMADNHWQIYNWDGKREEDHSGDFETVPIEAAPEKVVKTAVKAASLMGDGLYGVDLKMIDNKVYLIEVNDNPNIDAGIEDVVLKEELYLEVMRSLYKRIEMSRNLSRFISVEKY
ncbi:MAG: glutathione synthase [Bacteroidetes bacterium GWF2_42_66]|nr:MAG: glutathione synthase [Bacteroidetes bacterium GWA2_42_15]OFX98478.1 MAG: glutathione synthase [Bacteroidetes bacterium GWE2_42_39]OFY42863.1 MAG: glutathione synthase [Bacteroidetes bacterium GWF2_42_66]HBL74492.1 RimK family alpha-L-glutamate ligase [Prolixibacteraceae bacterium]HCR89030.1 RimK family alpha-L-glutamate ligase [Prolixibacteraceae bacterium]